MDAVCYLVERVLTVVTTLTLVPSRLLDSNYVARDSTRNGGVANCSQRIRLSLMTGGPLEWHALSFSSTHSYPIP